MTADLIDYVLLAGVFVCAGGFWLLLYTNDDT